MNRITKAYTLVGVDGNAFCLLAYTTKAMRNAGRDEAYKKAICDRAMAGDYSNLICVLDEELQKINMEFNLEYDTDDGE